MYNLQARLRPALLSIFPLFITVAVWTPALYKFATGLISLAVACGVTTLLAHLARSLGMSVQNRLVRKWGALPSTVFLRHSDDNIDAITKARRHKFLEAHVPNDWKAPTPEEERAGPDEADRLYESAVKWLLEHTRDAKRFPLLLVENISYGFRRNALGLKPIAITISVICVTFPVYRLHSIPWEVLGEKWVPHLSAGTVSCAVLLWWIFIVTDKWVWHSADAYAMRLLAACEETT